LALDCFSKVVPNNIFWKYEKMTKLLHSTFGLNLKTLSSAACGSFLNHMK